MNALTTTIRTSTRRLAMPVLTFPGASLAGTTVRAMVSNAEHQVRAQLKLRERFEMPFVMSAMDLSVEAEEFGATIQIADWEVPTVTGRLVTDMAGVRALKVPGIGTARSAVYIDTVRQLRQACPDAGVLAGMIGPFSLAGRLFGVSESLAETAGDPDIMHALLEKTTPYLLAYARAFKEQGADGVIIAEPTAGLMSPQSVRAFSSPYIHRMVEALDDDSFRIILHNCGARIGHLEASLGAGVRILHFGKPMDIVAALAKVPGDVILCGNLDPSEVFVGSSAAEVGARATSLLQETQQYRNFVISSGCDIPAAAPMANLEAFFRAVKS